MLAVGTKAPDFTLPDQNGELRKLSDYRGQKVILYFYPKDMTPGCTKQACGFAELYPQFRERGAVVLGISKDSVAPSKSLRRSTVCPLPSSRTRKKRSFSAMMSGRRRSSTARSLWVSCVRPTSLTKRASL